MTLKVLPAWIGEGIFVGARGFKLRLCLVYVALFFVIGIHLPFFPVWLKSKGFDEDQIAIVLSVMIGARIFSGPIFTFFADKSGRSRHVLQGLCLLVSILVCAMVFAQGFVTIFALCVIDTLLWAPVISMIEAYGVRESEFYGVNYGRLRLWGSLSFIAASLGGGIALDAMNAQAIIVALAAGHIVLFGACVVLVPARNEMANDGSRTRPSVVRLKDAMGLFTQRLFLLFLLAAGLAQASHALVYGFGTLHWNATGVPGGAIGLLWGVGVCAEVALFAFSGSALKWLGPAGLILLGAMAGVIRWTGTAFDPSLPVLFALQLLHGLTFGATHLGAIHFINKAVPRDLHNTAQGIYAALGVSLLMSIATAIAGGFYSAYGAFAFFAAAAMSLGAALAAWQLRVRWNGTGIIS
jgi:PPP family 3-phenylpropionic acid transporter